MPVGTGANVAATNPPGSTAALGEPGSSIGASVSGRVFRMIRTCPLSLRLSRGPDTPSVMPL